MENIVQRKAIGGTKTQVFGNANLLQTLIAHDLFHEYRIGIAPVILGSGRPLFPPGTTPKNLKFISTQQVATGGVVLEFFKWALWTVIAPKSLA